jgi:dinuclear metal center YbgI/SA1388 family protein
MLASELFQTIEKEVPLELALGDDPVGFIGPVHPEKIEVENVSVLLDFIPGKEIPETDLLVCHHPPLFPPHFPTYIIHSNWGIVQGGANDALAESLQLDVEGTLESETGIGRICSVDCTIDDFLEIVSTALPVDHLRVVKGKQCELKKIAIISGFGLNPHYIKLASEMGSDLLLSGDLTHPGSVLAQKLGINLVDATHQATEFPGLMKLVWLLNELGGNAHIEHTKKPWETYSCR